MVTSSPANQKRPMGNFSRNVNEIEDKIHTTSINIIITIWLEFRLTMFSEIAGLIDLTVTHHM